jgi:1,4-alpha-glucan branching enzyme
MADHLRFTQATVKLRADYPALRGNNVHPYWVSDTDRVLAFHRWLDGTGQDVIVVATLADTTWWGYQLGSRAVATGRRSSIAASMTFG